MGRSILVSLGSVDSVIGGRMVKMSGMSVACRDPGCACGDVIGAQAA
jgi:hypothetical protein